MVQPIKEGLDYFPMDVSFLGDVKVRRVRMACGMEAVGILVYLLGLIYQDHGYYEQWDKELCFLTAMELYLSEEVVEKVVQKAAQVGFFDEELLAEQGILTSSGIQSRFLTATRKRKTRRLIKEYVLVDVTEESRIELVSLAEKRGLAGTKWPRPAVSKNGECACATAKGDPRIDRESLQPVPRTEQIIAPTEVVPKDALACSGAKLSEDQQRAPISSECFQGMQRALPTKKDAQWDSLYGSEPLEKQVSQPTGEVTTFLEKRDTSGGDTGQSSGFFQDKSAMNQRSTTRKNSSAAQTRSTSVPASSPIGQLENQDREMWLANQRAMYLLAPKHFRLDSRFAVSEDELNWIYDRAL